MIKVMSFNIRTRSANDGQNSWQNRKRLVIERIRAFAPDLLGIQECRNDSQASFLKRKLPQYQFIAYERGGGHDSAEEMTPILIRRSTFDIEDQGCFWLSETPSIQGSTSWSSRFPRIVTWVKLRSKRDTSRRLYFINTHYDYANLQVQIESSRLLMNFIAGLENHIPIILCGDFNIEKESPPYLTLIEGNPACSASLHDPYRGIYPASPAEGTFHDFGALAKPVALDWILVSSHWVTLQAGLDKTHHGSLYPSDHYPLICKLKEEEQ